MKTTRHLARKHNLCHVKLLVRRAKGRDPNIRLKPMTSELNKVAALILRSRVGSQGFFAIIDWSVHCINFTQGRFCSEGRLCTFVHVYSSDKLPIDHLAHQKRGRLEIGKKNFFFFYQEFIGFDKYLLCGPTISYLPKNTMICKWISV